jgi:hypothetical protein
LFGYGGPSSPKGPSVSPVTQLRWIYITMRNKRDIWPVEAVLVRRCRKFGPGRAVGEQKFFQTYIAWYMRGKNKMKRNRGRSCCCVCRRLS